MRPSITPPILSERDEQIIRAIGFYNFMCADDIAELHFKRSSLSYARARLKRLAGGRDRAPRAFLCRFSRPVSTPGAKQKVYCLGVLGRNLLASVGLPVSGYYRPGKTLNYSHLSHALTLTTVVIAAQKTPGYSLSELRLSYELARNPPTVEMLRDGTPVTVPVIADAFAVFARDRDGELFPTLIEVDRGTMPQARIKDGLRCRLKLIDSGGYTRWSGRQSVNLLYLTDGETPEACDARRRALCRWVQEVFSEQKKEDWADLIRVTSLKRCGDIYEIPLFLAPVWHRADAAQPVPLLTP